MRDLVRPAGLGQLDVVVAGGDLVRRAREREQGLGDPPREVEAEEPGHDHAAAERHGQPLDERHPAAAQLRRRLGDHHRAEELVAELERLRDRDVVPALSGRERPGHVERPRAPLLEVFDRDDAPRQLRQRAGEQPEAGRERHVEDAVAAERMLEVRHGHLARPGLAGVQPHDPDRLGAELADRPRVLVALEEADRDQGRDDAGEDDSEQEEGRKPEAQRPEHGSRVLRYAAGVSRAGLTL